MGLGITAKISNMLSFTRVERNEAKISDVKIDSGGGANITAENFSSAGDDAFPLKTDYVLSVNSQATGRESVTGYLDPLNEPKALEGDKRSYSRENSDKGRVIAESWLKNDGTAVTNSFKVEGENITLVSSLEMSPSGTVTIIVYKSDGVTPKVTSVLSSDGTAKTFNEFGDTLLEADGGTVITTPGCTFETAANGSIKGSNGPGSFELQVSGNFVVNGVIIDIGGNVISPAKVSATDVEVVTSLKAAGLELAGHIHFVAAAPGDSGPNL